VNYGCPYDLLQDKQSILYDFIHKLGKSEEERLFQIAKNHATNDSDKIIINNEIESNNLFSNFDKNEEREGLL
jgi:hypothetical protein